MEHIETLLSRTPALVRLKLISRKRAFDSIFDGYNWEQFIINKLLQLNQFEYFFSFIHKTNDYMAVLNRVIASFQTPFWLQEKHWYTICSYAFESQTFELHSTTIHVTDSDNLIKFEKSAETNTCRLVGQPPKTDRKKTIGILNLAGNQIGDIGAEHLATALLNNTVRFDTKGFFPFCPTIQKTLVELNLRRNQIGMSGAQCFFKLQQNNTTINKLELSSNQIGENGAQYLSNALRNNATLSLLSLNMNSIENKGLQHIAACLIINKTITKLKLQQNKITDEGTYCLIDLLQNNNVRSTLQSLL
ncbi:unnamed protein product [Rotaria sp. Silwood2]|nr:unnamed protein product [Rotaria sp. Silwood2]